MPASAADSTIYGKLFSDADVAALFTDSAEVRAMMVVEGALAKAQGQMGVIPEMSAIAIHRASLELQLDPGALADSVGANAVPVPGLVTAFRDAMQAPEHAQWLHWGATSQDIIDTALALRLRQALGLIDSKLADAIAALAEVAKDHASLPLLARTYGQAAVVTSFGAVAASWGHPLLRHRVRLEQVKSGVAQVSLSGAAGTLSALGAEGTKVRAELATALGLSDPKASWHSSRDGIASLAGWLTGLMGSLAKMSEDLMLLTQSEVGEVQLGQGGASSTMPQKSNPVAPSSVVAMSRTAVGLNTTLQSAAAHRQQRDGGAWLSEWLTLPQLVILTAKATALTGEMAGSLAPVPEAMSRNIKNTSGFVFAEALSFALVEKMPRPEAQAQTKSLISEAQSSGRTLVDVTKEVHPDLETSSIFAPDQQLGTAPDEAIAFAKAVDLQI